MPSFFLISWSSISVPALPHLALPADTAYLIHPMLAQARETFPDPGRTCRRFARSSVPSYPVPDSHLTPLSAYNYTPTSLSGLFVYQVHPAPRWVSILQINAPLPLPPYGYQLPQPSWGPFLTSKLCPLCLSSSSSTTLHPDLVAGAGSHRLSALHGVCSPYLCNQRR